MTSTWSTMMGSLSGVIPGIVAVFRSPVYAESRNIESRMKNTPYVPVSGRPCLGNQSGFHPAIAIFNVATTKNLDQVPKNNCKGSKQRIKCKGTMSLEPDSWQKTSTRWSLSIQAKVHHLNALIIRIRFGTIRNSPFHHLSQFHLLIPS